jgi:hypothetical protein
MKASTYMLGLVIFSSIPVSVMADDITDRLNQITQSLNALKANNYQVKDTKTTNTNNLSSPNNNSENLVKVKKRVLKRKPVENNIEYENIGSLIKKPDWLTPEDVTLLSLNKTVYSYLISNTISENFHLDAPHYSHGKILNIVGYAPSDSEVWCIINDQKVILHPTQNMNQSQSVIFAGFFRQKDDNDFNTYQYSPCFIKQNNHAYKNMVILSR